MATERKDIKQPKPLPAPNSDFYQLAETLNAEELALVRQIRAFMEGKVAPIINKYFSQFRSRAPCCCSWLARQ